MTDNTPTPPPSPNRRAGDTGQNQPVEPTQNQPDDSPMFPIPQMSFSAYGDIVIGKKIVPKDTDD